MRLGAPTSGAARIVLQRHVLWLAGCGVAGATTVLAFAPFYLWFVPFATLAFLAWCVGRASNARSAAALGCAFGLGYFLVGTSWIYVSLHDYGGMSMPLAAFATAFFCTYLALFPAAACWITRRFDVARGVRLAVVFPVAWTLTEWVRGWLFTGFPWILVGYSQTPGGPLAGLASIVGVYGVSLAVATCAGMIAWWAPWSRWRQRQGGRLKAALSHPAPFLLLLLLLGGIALKQVSWTRPLGAPVSVTLAQGNIEQDIKWRPESVRDSLDTYLRLTLASRSQLILLPETALPLFNTEVPPQYLELLARHARQNGGDLLLGVPEYVEGSPSRYYNSVMSYGTAPTQAYRKHHLVPFGDYFPRWFFITWVMNALDIPMSDFSRGDGIQRPIEAAGQRVAVNICYEDAFGEEIIRQLPEATLLANFTNDAWWGDSIASEQHLQMAQMRALETGRYMLRATNTGMTAIIDQRGHIQASAPQFVTTSLTGNAQGYAGATPYVTVGNWAFLAVALGALLMAAVWRVMSPRLGRSAVNDASS